MRTSLAVLLLSLLMTGGAFAQDTGTIRISSTIGPVDAGIIPLLADTFGQRTGIKATYEKAGTGETLKKARTGDFDMVIVHARKLEDKFIADGFGVDRRDVMYNDFVILGPKEDPAGIRGMKDATEAFRRLATRKAMVVTRGDNSGTHVKEMEVWSAAGIEPGGDWYVVYPDGAKGNKATTQFADEKNAYVLMDRATWLTLKDSSRLAVLVEKDPLLLNYIALIRVNPEKFPQVNTAGALQLADWLTGEEAQGIIKTFGVEKYGEPLFFPNATPR
ncbi:substrate-binding domain-containing protein [Nitratidesulfovibrio sp. SRB-5]|uniref:substrate-binding domain-containing protein n=1 Tax=Nitratidesulfovibrio sp. SRB-5 TaxID=2872636 RepID=UPI001027AB15|nr:substrate-binding domain-containing protein [Nitratidesulfovibrio sp. SRB-5]MBZ2170936.1 substrate-binding domain-containing protein [Nitratidesulfovibrio sp. SRB-5]RXF77877.1 tungsten ABC transporter permease [Desulfovibrio sp. DS-1]